MCESRFISASFIAMLLLLPCGCTQAQSSNAASGDESKEFSLTRIPPKEPAESLKSIETRPGFHVELVAAEPLVRDPIAVAFDENGRMFVVEFPEYNHRHAGWTLKEKGRVRLLEDSDGDGRCDQSTIFADGLASPTGLICYDGGLFIGAAPDILFCKDTDGDGRADVRKVVFTGFGVSENRGGGARLNSFRWGLDNRIHVCTSFSGGEIKRAGDESSQSVSVRNRRFTFDPRTLEYETDSGSGQHGLAMDDWGRFFLCNNSDPFRLLMYESRYLVRNPHVVAPPSHLSIAADGKFTRLHRISPVEPWRIERTRRRVAGTYKGSAEGGAAAGFFTSASGVAVYRGDAWPDEYRGDIFVCQPSGNLVHRAKLGADGVELVATRADAGIEFLAARDNWFRPVELAGAPDGTLYAVDMYRELIETAVALPPDVLKQLLVGGGTKRGRIYRIAPDNLKRKTIPRLAEASTEELVALLEHPDGWHRDTAARLLYERQDRQAIAPLKELAQKSQRPQGRMTALYALDGMNALDAATILVALDDTAPHVRVHAVRLAEKLAGQSAEVRQQLLAMTGDDDRRVRYQLAFSLGEVDPRVSPARNASLAQLVRNDGGDHWFRFAVLTSLNEGAGDVFRELAADAAFRQSKHGRTMLVSLARQIGAANQRDEIARFTMSLDELSADDRSLQHSLVRALIERQGRAKRAQILATAGNSVSRVVDELLSAAKAAAVNEKLAPANRAEAIGVLGLGEFSDLSGQFESLLELQQPLQVQAAVLDTLARFNSPEVADLILDAWPQFSPQLRARATETILSRRIWVAAWLDAVEAGRVSRGDVDSARVTLLKKHPNAEIRARVDKLFAGASPRRAEVVQRYRPALQLTGDPLRGKQVFKKVCAACHKLDGVGREVGAELSAIRQRGPSAVMLNILDPNREVKPKFQSYVVQTDDGRVHTGMIAAENANGVTLRRADGTTLSLQRTEIEQLGSTGLSFMPEGLEKELDHQAMADLLEYLSLAD